MIFSRKYNGGVMKKYGILILLLPLFFFSINVYANDENKEISKLYKEWLSLDEKQRKNVPEPHKYMDDAKYKIKFYNNKIPFSMSAIIPEKYDMRDIDGTNHVSSVKNQGSTELCWSFASSSAFETNFSFNNGLLYNLDSLHTSNAINFTFSDYVNPFGMKEINTSGNLQDSVKYWTSGLGPVINSNNDGKTLISAQDTLNNVIDLSLDESYVLDYYEVNNYSYGSIQDRILEIKKELLNNHGVVFYSAAPYKQNDYYNNNYFSVYTDNSEDYLNNAHAMQIIGWDDNFSKEKFNNGSYYGSKPSIDGAWIVKNSWGDGCYDLEERIQNLYDYALENWGKTYTRDELIELIEYNGYTIYEETGRACLNVDGGKNGGYVYYSYEDYNLNRWIEVVSKTSFKNYDYIYQYNPTGDNYSSNKYKDTITIFDKSKDVEILNSIAVKIDVDVNSNPVDYELYINYLENDFSMNDFQLLQSGTLGIIKDGYYTINIKPNVELVNQQFALELKLTNASLMLSEKSNSYIDDNSLVGIINNQSYYLNNNILIDISNENKVTQLKAFTKNKVETNDLKLNTIIKTSDDFSYKKNEKIVLKTISNIGNGKVLNYKIINDNNEDISNFFDYNNGIIVSNMSISTLTLKQDLNNSNCFIQTYYEDNLLDSDNLNTGKGIELSNLTTNPIISEIGGILSFKIFLKNIELNEITNNIDIKILNSDNNEVLLSNSEFDDKGYADINVDIPKTIPSGTYKIKVSVDNYEVEEEFEIIPYVHVESIVLNKNNITLIKGNTETLTATINPSNAMNKNLTWSSSDSNIVTVDNNGLITGKKRGTATITITSEDGSKTDTCEVIVKEPKVTIGDSTITSNYENKLYAGYGGKVETEIILQDIEKEELTIKYYKGNEEIESSLFDASLLEENNKLKLKMYVNTSLDKGNYKVEISRDSIETKSFEFEVYEPVLVNSISLSNIKLYLNNAAKDIEFTINPNDATNKNIDFEIGDNTIVKLEDGKLTGLKVGETTLTLTAKDGSNVTKTVSVEVLDKNIELSNLTTNPIISEIGGILSFKIFLKNIELNEITNNIDIKILNSDNNEVLLSNSEFDDKGYADINVDIPKTIPSGTYKIKVSVDNYEVEEEFEIIPYVHVESIVLNKNNITLIKGNTETLTATINPSNAMNKNLTWSSSDSNIVTVDNNGLITGKKRGTATITITSEDGSKTDTCEVIVKEPKVTIGDSTITSNYENKLYAGYGGKVETEIILQDIEKEELTIKYYKGSEEIENSLFDSSLSEENNIIILRINVGVEVSIGTYKVEISSNNIETIEKTFEILEYTKVTDIEISKSNVEIYQNEQFDLSTLITIIPINAINKDVKFEISNDNITINNKIITGKKTGSSVIKVISLDKETIYKEITVTIKEKYVTFNNNINVLKENDSNYLSGVVTNRTFTELKSNISTNQEVNLYKSDGKTLVSNTSLVGTGMILRIGADNYEMVVRADLNGDGKQTITDLSQLRQHLAVISGKTKTGAYLQASDLSGDNKVSIVDLSKMRKELAG